MAATELLILPLLLLFSSTCTTKAQPNIIISEVSDKGTFGVCGGNDWMELYNEGNEPVDLSQGYILHDDKGLTHEKAYHFSVEQPTLIAAQDYLLLCCKVDLNAPQFGIGSTDTISLVQLLDSSTEDNNTEVARITPTQYIILSTVSLPAIPNNGLGVTKCLEQ